MPFIQPPLLATCYSVLKMREETTLNVSVYEWISKIARTILLHGGFRSFPFSERMSMVASTG
jgi:hypothetical protein